MSRIFELYVVASKKMSPVMSKIIFFKNGSAHILIYFGVLCIMALPCGPVVEEPCVPCLCVSIRALMTGGI